MSSLPEETVVCYYWVPRQLPLLSLEGQNALGIHQKYLNLGFKDEQKVLRVWNNIGVTNQLHNLNFWVNFPYVSW